MTLLRVVLQHALTIPRPIICSKVNTNNSLNRYLINNLANCLVIVDARILLGSRIWMTRVIIAGIIYSTR